MDLSRIYLAVTIYNLRNQFGCEEPMWPKEIGDKSCQSDFGSLLVIKLLHTVK